MKPSELRPFFESLAGQLSSCLDNHAYFFQSQIDPVSGLFNRRFFDSRLAIECQRSTGQHTPLSLMLLEVGLVATRDGGVGGDIDVLLHSIGQAVKRRIRGADFVGRVGEIQFGILLPDTTAPDALLLAESLRHTVSSLLFGKSAAMTCGIAGFSWTVDTAETLFANAEQALVNAKPVAATKAS